MLFYIRVFFEAMSRQFKFHSSLTVTLHDDMCTFMIVSVGILLRMRYFSDKSCRETQNTHFKFNNFFFEKHALYEVISKILVEQIDHI
jgi:hypothetical protein